jgi:hypothetical protein
MTKDLGTLAPQVYKGREKGRREKIPAEPTAHLVFTRNDEDSQE